MVVLRFIVNKTGEISDVVILRSVAPSLDEEAVRVVKTMPKWIPGKQAGKPVAVYYTIPVQFTIRN
jgi:protein TonB